MVLWGVLEAGSIPSTPLSTENYLQNTLDGKPYDGQWILISVPFITYVQELFGQSGPSPLVATLPTKTHLVRTKNQDRKNSVVIELEALSLKLYRFI